MTPLTCQIDSSARFVPSLRTQWHQRPKIIPVRDNESCGKVAENGSSRRCFQRLFHHASTYEPRGFNPFEAVTQPFPNFDPPPLGRFGHFRPRFSLCIYLLRPSSSICRPKPTPLKLSSGHGSRCIWHSICSYLLSSCQQSHRARRAINFCTP
jgi:hypothetical protein